VRHRIAETNALGRYALYDYCACGALDSIRDAAGNTNHFYYDNQGRLTETVYADGFVVTNAYNLLGQRTATLDSAGTATAESYNNQGLLVAVSNAFGRVQSALYDQLDRPTNSLDANAVAVTTTYDELNRVRTRAHPDGAEKFGYSARGMVAYTNQ